MKNSNKILSMAFLAASIISLKAPSSAQLGNFILPDGQTNLILVQESCVAPQNGANCPIRSVMTAIAMSSRAAQILKPKTALEISQLEDYFARLFYKYLFKAGKIDRAEYSKSLISGHRFALSEKCERNDVEGFLRYLKQKGIFGVAAPLEPVIVVESVPLIVQSGFRTALSQANNLKIWQFINGFTGKLRIILFNYQVLDKVNDFGRIQKVEVGNHWVCVELSRNAQNPRTITATIIDSKVVDPRRGSMSTARLVKTFVAEAVKTFGPHRNTKTIKTASSAKKSSEKTIKLKPCLKTGSAKSSKPSDKQKVSFNFAAQKRRQERALRLAILDF